MMKRLLLSFSLVLAIGAIVAVAGAATGFQQSDCPGKVVCPLTGDEVCRDQCPLVDANRDDCPGKIECPITGELVCRDKCPVGDANGTEEPGSCCGSCSK